MCREELIEHTAQCPVHGAPVDARLAARIPSATAQILEGLPALDTPDHVTALRVDDGASRFAAAAWVVDLDGAVDRLHALALPQTAATPALATLRTVWDAVTGPSPPAERTPPVGRQPRRTPELPPAAPALTAAPPPVRTVSAPAMIPVAPVTAVLSSPTGIASRPAPVAAARRRGF